MKQLEIINLLNRIKEQGQANDKKAQSNLDQIFNLDPKQNLIEFIRAKCSKSNYYYFKKDLK